MRLTCPNCAASYDVPDHRLAGAVRRPVLCTRCGTVWTPSVPEAEARAAAGAPAQHRPESGFGGPAGTGQAPAPAVLGDETPRGPPPPREPESATLEEEAAAAEPGGGAGRLALAAAWLVSLALVAGGLAALWVWRAEVSALWPPARRLFAWLGG